MLPIELVRSPTEKKRRKTGLWSLPKTPTIVNQTINIKVSSKAAVTFVMQRAKELDGKSDFHFISSAGFSMLWVTLEWYI